MDFQVRVRLPKARYQNKIAALIESHFYSEEACSCCPPRKSSLLHMGRIYITLVSSLNFIQSGDGGQSKIKVYHRQMAVSALITRLLCHSHM